MRKIFNTQSISAYKHTILCEGNEGEVLLPEVGVNEHLHEYKQEPICE